jgi:hypothetical protein
MANPAALSADDRLAIIELMARYARCLDAGDVDAYVANFTPDGVLQSSRGRSEGHAEIHKVLEEITGSIRRGVRHLAGIPVIDGDAGRCSVRSYSLVLAQNSDGACSIASIVQYLDTCVKVDGRWLFEERIIERLMADDRIDMFPVKAAS